MVAWGLVGDEKYVSADLKLVGDPLSLDQSTNRPTVGEMKGFVVAEKPKGSAINLVFVFNAPEDISPNGMHLELRKIFDVEVVKVSPIF